MMRCIIQEQKNFRFSYFFPSIIIVNKEFLFGFPKQVPASRT